MNIGALAVIIGLSGLLREADSPKIGAQLWAISK